MFNGLVEDWVNEGLGIDYAELLGPRRIGLPTVALQTEFRAPSRHGDAVELGLALARIGSRSLELALELRSGTELRVSARQTLVTTSLTTHRAIEIPADLRAALLRFQASGEAPHA